MVAERRPERMTVDEWRALERASPDTKHEYFDGHVYAMAGGSSLHSGISVNIIATLYPVLGDGPCRVYNSDLATRVSASRYTYPDVVISCDVFDAPSRDRTELEAPRVVFEVLSDSTERTDRGRKWDYYRQCPSLQEYVLVGTEYQRVEVYRRTGTGWDSFQIYGPADELELQSINAHFPVAAIYRRTEVPEAPPD